MYSYALVTIPVDNAEMPKDSSVCKTAPICMLDQKEMLQVNNSVPQNSAKSDEKNFWLVII